jgi:phenylalanyl-tRNA synthetase alpha chain
LSQAAQPLHPIEKKILKTLSSHTRQIRLQSLSEQSALSIDQVRRGIEWLKSKGLISVEEVESVVFSLGKLGESSVEIGLPERRLVNDLKKSGGTEVIGKLSKQLGEEFAAALGIAKKNGWIRVDKGLVHLEKESENREPEEDVLEKLAGEARISKDELDSEELKVIASLRKRQDGFVNEISEKTVHLALTPEGRAVSQTIVLNELDEITPEVLRSGSWRNQPLRAIDVSSPAPTIFPGRRHPMRVFMDEVRETFLSLDFEEIYGPMSQSALWNFDALFIPQQHPAREMQDTFYLSKTKANLEKYESEIRAIKGAHESGGETGSRGWRYPWSLDEASRVVLRTHTTAVTISYLAEKKPEEARVFSVGRVFRNEKSNYKHNPEFYQIEGVMVGEKLNVRNLIYIMTKFYSKLGFNEIKFWPTFFPYTEPSLQTMAYLKETGKWLELGGMGPFRPEVTLPLGVKNPVLAWGLSLDRLVMLRYKVEDIRQLFGANIGWLRKLKVQN